MEIIAVLLLVVSVAILFATEAVRVDVVAIIVLVALGLSGIVTPEEALSGFSNPATATVAAMFVISGAFRHTGLVEGITAVLGGALGRTPWLLYLAIIVLVAAVSAFVNNTAAVAVFIPIVLGLERSRGVDPHRLLMPLSFASQTGGLCTLIGTSTNILVADIAMRAGLRPFGMFEFTRLGIVFTIVAIAYLTLVGPFLLRRRGEAGRASAGAGSSTGTYLAELVVEPGSNVVGRELGDLTSRLRFDVTVLEIIREGGERHLPRAGELLREGDTLLIIGSKDDVLLAGRSHGLGFRRDMRLHDAARSGGGLGFVECIVPPASPLVGRTLEELRFRQARDCQALAIRHHDRLEVLRVGKLRLAVGDVLLLQGPRPALDRLEKSDELILLEEVRSWKIAWPRALATLAIVAGIVVGASTGVAPILILAIAGCAALVLGRVVTMEQAYAAIDWKVIFLLAGVIPLGTALEKTGAASLLAEGIVGTLGAWGPTAILAGFYVVTTVLTQIMSNNASAALLAPLAIASAVQMGADPRPLLVAVIFGASASFLTPIGYQTNAMVLGPGGYKFSDFARVGSLLNVILLVIAVVLIPRFFPF
jgi:di/tricarboxylate transporter